MNAPDEVRARIGLIIPSSNRLTEPQMRHYAPTGVEIHVTRLRMTGASHVPLAELLPRIVESTLALSDARCDAIVFHCTASSMEAGLHGEQQVIEAMRGATAAQVATTATATLAALRALKLDRIALFSPYVAATHAHARNSGATGTVTRTSGCDEQPGSALVRVASMRHHRRGPRPRAPVRTGPVECSGDDRLKGRSRTDDVLKRTYDFYSKTAPFEPSLQPTLPGIKAMMEFLSGSVPKLANYTPEQFVDTRFLSQLPV